MEENKRELFQILLAEVRGLQEDVVSLSGMLKERSNEPVKQQYCSEHLNELGAALAKAQADIVVAGWNRDNTHFKQGYADLAEVVRVSRMPLSRNGLAMMQIPNEDDNGLVLITRLQHVSGQWVESRMRIKPLKNDIQALASYLSYCKRYAWASLIGVVSSGEDDDAEIAVASNREVYAKGAAVNNKYNPRDQDMGVISRDQLDMLEVELEDFDDIAEQVLEGLRIRNLADMPKNRFAVSIQRIREIKAARDGK